MERRQQGNKHIGIVFNLVQIEVVLVIIVGAFVGIKVDLQFCLQPGISRLRP